MIQSDEIRALYLAMEAGRMAPPMSKNVGQIMRLSATLLVMILLSTYVTIGQSGNPVLAGREKLAGLLNAALASQSNTISGDCTGIQVLDEDGNCVQLDPARISIQYYGNPSRFSLALKTKPEGDVSVENAPSLLVDDLNAYIQSMGMEIQKLSPINSSLSSLYTCGGSGPFKRYFTGNIPSSNSSWIEAIRATQGVDRIQATKYYINGVWLHGSDFLTFEPDPNNKSFNYIADRDIAGGSPYGPNAIAELASLYLSIKTGTDKSFEIQISSWTRQYPGNGASCDLSYSGGSNTTPFYEVTFATRDNSLAPPNDYVVVGRCYESFYNASPTGDAEIDVENGELLNYKPVVWFNLDEQGHLVIHSPAVSGEICTVPEVSIMKVVGTHVAVDSCYEQFCLPGTFQVDQFSGDLVYHATQPSNCDVDEYTPDLCINFCDNVRLEYKEKLAGVVSASAVDYADQWKYDTVGLGGAYPGSNEYEIGELGKWRTSAHYSYRSGIKGGSGISGNTAERVYDGAGTFQLTLFNYRFPARNDVTTWLPGDIVTQYSPNGLVVEDKDILGIPSAMRLGDLQQLPILVAKNARYNRVAFDSFEDSSSSPRATAWHAHSGKRSLVIAAVGESDGPLDKVASVAALPTYGADPGESSMIAKFWVKHSIGMSDTYCPVDVRFGDDGASYDAPEFVARSGDWTLYQKTLNSSGAISLSIKRNDAAASGSPDDSIWIDDVRIQPLEAHVAASVYDQDAFRLAANFDDDHFGTFYQYNGEGRLVRKIQETEHGMKTVEESQYNRPLLTMDQVVNYAGATTTGGGSPSGLAARKANRSYTISRIPRPDTTAGMKADLLNLAVDTSGVSFGTPVADSLRAMSSRIDEALSVVKRLSADSTNASLMSRIRKTTDELRAVDVNSSDSLTIARRTELEAEVKHLTHELSQRSGMSGDLLEQAIELADPAKEDRKKEQR